MEPMVERNADDSSSESEEDEDYFPCAEPSENVSEEEEDGDPEENTGKGRKRKSDGGNENVNAKRRRKRAGDESEDDSEDDDDDNEEEIEVEDPETIVRRELAEKQRTDRLWADFLTDVETTKSKRKEERETGFKAPTEKVVTKVYDFAGERVKMEEKVKIEPPQINGSTSSNGTTSENQEDTPNGSENGNSEDDTPKKLKKYRISFLSGNPADIGLAGKGVSAKEGLANVLNALHARNKKLGTLEKSKLDWETYKRDQNLHEELSSHNRGKNGFIDKQDFLQRADVRQFEIEKAARSKRRKPL